VTECISHLAATSPFSSDADPSHVSYDKGQCLGLILILVTYHINFIVCFDQIIRRYHGGFQSGIGKGSESVPCIGTAAADADPSELEGEVSDAMLCC
jgi:hypothetical protein